MGKRQKLGVCYYPEHWPEDRWPEDAKLMRQAGISLVRIGEFAWSRLEPEDGRYTFEWLDRSIETLDKHDLKVVLGTPTAAPPRWLVDKMPDMLPVDANGRTRGFGSRRHYCFSHHGYRAECARIVTALATRYGNHPAVAGWQVDNEYGGHDTVRSYSKAALAAFRAWLADKYQSIQALNTAWGNVFWSMEYASFGEIGFPTGTVTDPNPAHSLDFQRFCSDEVISFNKLQTCIVRRLSPGRTILHNFMGGFTAFDHFALSNDLDAAAWDSYPLGFLDRDYFGAEHWERYMRVGDPDFQAFHHDLYRACGRGSWWVMEQQPGAINWAPYNPSPAPGAVRLWTHEAFAAGAEVVSYFRWRQPPFGQEQMHEALLLTDGTTNEAWHAAREIAAEIKGLNTTTGKSDVAIVYDYESAWAWAIQPHGRSFSYLGLAFTFYQALRKLGVSVDFVPANPGAVEGYRLLLIPGLFTIPDELADAIGRNGQIALVGPRAGSRTRDFRISPTLPPGPGLQSRIDIKIRQSESLAPMSNVEISASGENCVFERWREFISTGSNAIVADETTADGEIARCHSPDGSIHYLAGWPNPAYARAIAGDLCAKANIVTHDLHRDIRLRRNGELTYVLNYGPETIDISGLCDGRQPIIGASDLPPCGVAVFPNRSDRGE